MNTAVIYNSYDITGPNLQSIASRPLPQKVYRRRRLVFLSMVGLIVFLSVLMANEIIGRINGVPGGSVVEAAGQPVVYVVQPGDTLWEIADKFNPEGTDIRHTVDELANITGGAQLQPGQRIVLNRGL